MDLIYNTVINFYSISLLLAVCIHIHINDEKECLQHKLHMTMLLMTILMLVVDIFSRFDGKANTIYNDFNHIGNFLIFILNPVLPSLWLLYVHVHIFQEEGKTRRLYYPLIALNAANAVVVLLTQFFGWYYYIDSDNIYHRGPLFLLSASITFIVVFAAFVLIIANRKTIEKRHFYSLLFFAVPPFLCIILQLLFYGVSLVLNSVVISILIVVLNIQNHTMYTDYLTGVNNRKKLDYYLRDKISASTNKKTFSAILIDLNNFKSINDTFGHNMGDKVLQIFVKLLKHCLRTNDFIARFGGDEFCIILNISNLTDLNEIIQRINDVIEQYNEHSNEPYKLGLSMGYAVYDYSTHIKAEEFLKLIDVLLYENKQITKK